MAHSMLSQQNQVQIPDIKATCDRLNVGHCEGEAMVVVIG